MTKIKRVVLHDGKTIELAFPVYLSDDEIHIADGVYGNRRSAASADAVFLFNIIQKQIEQLMADKEEKNENQS